MEGNANEHSLLKKCREDGSGSTALLIQKKKKNNQINNKPIYSYQFNQQLTVAHPSVTLSRPNPNPNDAVPVPISLDDDDSFKAPPPPPPPPETSDSPISDSLLRLGLRLKREWLDSCARGLESSVSVFSNLDVSTKAKLCFQQFLFSDMNYFGAGMLPANVDSTHLVDLKGPFVLQVDGVVNISCPLRGRYQDASCGIKRCLKLSMADGVQRMFGMENRPIRDLKVLAPARLKVVISNVHVRRGLLMLVPESLDVLGGMVQGLEEAHQLLVDEVNKPPKGKRFMLSPKDALVLWQDEDRSSALFSN